jgi:LacI family transcriptional regulator
MRRACSRGPGRPPAKAPRRNVALIVETSVVYGRQILHGIARYLKTHTAWSVFLDERELLMPPPDWLSHWKGDGVICRSTTSEWARIFRRRRLPVVDLNDLHLDLGLPRVASDMRAIGRLGAEHLRERGFRHLAFCGFSGETWSEQRREGFAAAAEGAVTAASIYESPWGGLREHPWEQERNQIARWLQSLPRPVGILACNDVRGQHVLDACGHLGAQVPDEVAVVGVDNAETFCELCNPPLSSVVPNAEGIGFEAAAMLDGLMAGSRASERGLLVEPLGVVTRQSSDVFAVEDPLVARAVRFIREQACQGIKVADVLSEVRCSRSLLERRFREHLGHSPQEELRAIQLRRVRELLTETDWTLPRIAAAAGIEHPEYLSVIFKRETGQTPGQFRQRPRSPQPATRHSRS